MANDNDKGPLVTISGLAIILAVLGVAFSSPKAFKSPRPAVSGVRASEKVDARLWQDPFRAVIEGAKSFQSISTVKPKASFVLYTSHNCHADSCPTDSIDGATTVLGVMVPGAPYAEDTEQRIRYRYAVLSALSRLGYTPEDPEHLSYFRWKLNNEPASGPLSLSNILPFEKFTYPGKENSVLVLWINDDRFGGNPLAMLNSLAGCLGFNGNLQERFMLLGPAASPTLQQMLSEAKTHPRFCKLSGLRIYNALATADYSLLAEAIKSPVNSSNIFENLSANHITYKRTIHSDKELTRLLVKELRQRNVDFNDERDHIVLISEWDTNYGRSLPEEFTQSVSDWFSSQTTHKSAMRAQMHQYSYMRGIDGSRPGEKEEKKDEKTDAGHDPAEHLKKLEQPMGESQYDYLRRLAQDIHRNWHQETTHSIKAIGVLGSDFYDKFLVLQAFRQQFPEAIYFTTDLDARYLHPDAIQWTRNLVVASSFDLSLKDIQGGVPPFRDGYQTSLFFATLLAIAEKENRSKNPPDAQSDLRKAVTDPTSPMLHPLLFEIGRHSAVKLTTDDVPPHRAYSTGKKIKGWVLAVLIPAILFLLVSCTSDRGGNLWDACRKRPWLAFGIALALYAVVICFYRFILGRPWEEPFFLFEGVSIWPTEVLRLIAALFSVGSLFWSIKINKDNKEAIRGDFGFSGSYGNVGRGIDCQWEADNGGGHLCMDDLWAEYLQHDSKRSRLRRLVPAFGCYFLLSIGIGSWFGFPNTPVRGLYSGLLNIAVLLTSVTCFLLLVFYVFDVCRTCRHFIDKAAKSAPDWSGNTADIFADECDSEARLPIGEWLLIKLIARRTDAVGKLIFFPFIAWFIMFVARNHYFDNWAFNIGLMVIFAMSLVFAWTSAVLLRRAAERARTVAMDRLKKQILENCNTDREQVKKIAVVLNEIRSISEGAFLPFMQRPAVQALLLPFSGVGGVYLIEYLEKINP
jgi:hypothetical protein